jgi:hypothetical protein
MSDSSFGKNFKMATDKVKESDVKNFDGMYYQGKKEGVDFLLCPRDHKSKCLNFTAGVKYKHAMDMYNDGGEAAFCRHCQTGAPKRLGRGKESLKIAHQRNQEREQSSKGVRVGNEMIPYNPRKVA